MIKFADFTKQELAAVARIQYRVAVIARKQYHTSINGLSLRMDLAAVHARTPLRLEDLSDADDFNLIHDVFGIIKHMDRSTGELTGYFVPRYSK